LADVGVTLEQTLALVGELERDGALLADADGADDELAWSDAEFRPLDAGGGQGVEEAGQANVPVGVALRLAGGPCQVGPPDAGEEAGEGAIGEQLAGLLPLEVAALHDLVEGATASAGGEDELLQQLSRRGHAGPLIEQTA